MLAYTFTKKWLKLLYPHSGPACNIGTFVLYYVDKHLCLVGIYPPKCESYANVKNFNFQFNWLVLFLLAKKSWDLEKSFNWKILKFEKKNCENLDEKKLFCILSNNSERFYEQKEYSIFSITPVVICENWKNLFFPPLNCQRL